MPDPSPYPFALAHHPDKADPVLIDDDVRHFARIRACVAQQVADLDARLTARRRVTATHGQDALDRDLDIHRMTTRLRLLRRFGPDLCLGHIVGADGTRYIGRAALSDDDGEPLLVDWRAPAAEPFFAATLADPRGLRRRRRYRWVDGHVADYWDEAFTDDARAGDAALDDQSAFIASLAASRTPHMRDVLSTIQADQDAVIRAPSRGTLVVDGGPGTGKTVVALHRAAYLLYADPQIRAGHGGILFVGPSRAYTSYVADILPALDEEGVPTCTIADLVPGIGDPVHETDATVAQLKAGGRMPGAIDAAVDRAERPPRGDTLIDTPWGGVRVTAADWDEAIGAADPASTHNDARDDIWAALVAIVADRIDTRGRGGWDAGDPVDDLDSSGLGAVDGLSAAEGARDRWNDEGWGDAGTTAWDDERRAEEAPRPGLDDAPRHGFDDEEPFDAYGVAPVDTPAEAVTRWLAESPQLRTALDRIWPLVDPDRLVRQLWTSPRLLRACAPWLTAADVQRLQRPAQAPWTREDLPLLDAARLRIGDPKAALRRRRAEADAAAERARMSDVIDDLIATDDSDMRVMSMLRGQDMRGVLEPSSTASADRDILAGPFAHIVVDEAQELTDAEWRMLVRRNPSGSFTVVGDRAQARHGFASSWTERLAAAGLRGVREARLTVNYRTPVEIMREATPVIRAVIPEAAVPTSVRSTGIPVRHGHVGECDDIVGAWLASHAEGTVCIVGGAEPARGGVTAATPSPGDGDVRVRRLDPLEAKGLEFDLVVLVDGVRFTAAGAGGAVEAAVDRYVTMTRATGELVVLADP